MKCSRCGLRIANVVNAALGAKIDALGLKSGLKVMNMKYAEFVALRRFTQAYFDFFWRTR
jgi:hypothetical protein